MTCSIVHLSTVWCPTQQMTAGRCCCSAQPQIEPPDKANSTIWSYGSRAASRQCCGSNVLRGRHLSTHSSLYHLSAFASGQLKFQFVICLEIALAPQPPSPPRQPSIPARLPAIPVATWGEMLRAEIPIHTYIYTYIHVFVVEYVRTWAATKEIL